MRDTLYVTTPGATICREGDRVKVRMPDGKVTTDLPAIRVGQVVAVGGVAVTPEYVRLAEGQRIDTVFVTTGGQFRARLDTGVGHFVEVRLAQYRLWENGEAKTALARRFVEGKIRNGRTFLARLARKRKDSEAMRTVAALGKLAGMTVAAPDVESLRGIEGTAAALYFRAFRAFLLDDLGFDGRNRRPPRDPVNCLLSFGYTLLLRHVDSAVRIAGLDPYLGCLHAPLDRRRSLSLDLMEEWRPVLVDGLVMRLVNTLEATRGDFELCATTGGYVLERGFLARFVKKFEQRLAETVVYGNRSKPTPWRNLILGQALKYRRHLLGKEPTYEPFLAR